MEHPSAKEGFTDRLYRNLNEMVSLLNCALFFILIQDFEGQKLAEKITRNVMALAAVSRFNNYDTPIRVN